MVNYCCICGVEKSTATSHLIFHSLPKDKDIRNQWLKILNKGNIKHLLVCSNHFRPDDYRESSQKPLLKKEAVPRLDNFANINVQSIENEEINYEYNLTEMDETYNSVNVSNVESSMLTESNNLKRKNDDHNESIPGKRYCYLGTNGIFRQEDFKDEATWNRFLNTLKDIKKEKILLQRKNERLYKKVEKFKDIVYHLKEKNLLTDSVADLLQVS